MFYFGTADDDDTTAGDPLFVAKDNGDGTFSLLVASNESAAIISNQTTIIAKLTAIENLLSGGINVNVLSGGGSIL